MVFLYIVIASIILIAALLWCLKIISTTYLDLYERGLDALKKRDYKRARNMFLKSLSKNPDFLEAKYNLGLAYLSIEEYEKAKEYFEKVLEETPDDFSALFNLALAFQLDELYDEALEIYQKAILLEPQDVDCYLNIAVIHFEKEDYQKSIEYLVMARDISPDNTAILFSIVRCKDEMCLYENEDEIAAILGEYEFLLEKTDLPNEFDIALAKAYAKSGRIDDSIEKCLSALEKDYFDDEACRLLGLLLLIKNDSENARKNILKAIDIDPDIPESYNLLSYVFFLEENMDEFTKMKAKYKNIALAAKTI